MTNIYYPTEFKIQYTNDKEYRAIIRKLFKMSSHILSLSPPLADEEEEDIDEITRDEWDFDQGAITLLFDFIYSTTGKNQLFDEMYKKAAGFMLSEDPSIGLAILFSYDYLMDFHPVLCDYFLFIKNGCLRTLRHNPDGSLEECSGTFNSTIPSIVHLHKRLSK